MARPISPGGKRVAASTRYSEDVAERVEAARGAETVSEWLREAALVTLALSDVRKFPLDMAAVTCPYCTAQSYPDNLGEAIDWAVDHQCIKEA
jgi:hypothetical protein